MESTSTSLRYRIFEPTHSRASSPLLLMLHGHGADESDLAALAPDLTHHFRVLSVRAPHALYWGGFSWYDIQPAPDLRKVSNLAQAEQSLGELKKLVAEVKDTYLPPAGSNWILGFSQGAILGQALALSMPHDFQGILALSGYLWEDLLPSALPVHPRPFIYQAHGMADPVIPLSLARSSHAFLHQHNWPTRYQEFDMGHTISQESWQDALTTLRDKAKP